MSLFMQKIVLMTMAFSTLSMCADAYCAKCMKIERERAKEQAEHPQKWDYYDDQAKANTKLKEKKAREIQERMNSNNAISYNDAHSSPERRPAQLASNNTYSTVLAILQTKEFLKTLSGSFTLIVPTDAALNQLNLRGFQLYDRPENREKLAQLISNHVVAKKILQNDFLENNNKEVKAISGRNLTLSHKNGKYFIDNIQIIRTEPAGNDGIIYVIDSAFQPEENVK